jgi:hypothetical protein
MRVGERQGSTAGLLARCAVAAVFAIACAGMPASIAGAQDLGARLGEAEGAVASAESEVAEAEANAKPARARFRAARREAVPARQAAAAAQRTANGLEVAQDDRRQAAADRIARIEAEHQDEVDEHDQQVSAGIALAIAALVAGAIALGWNRFRGSPPVAWLTGQSRAQAIAICLFGGFALIVIGVALAGAVEAIGLAVAMLGIVLPIALLLALRSVEVEKGEAKPVTGRERFPGWVSQAVAAAMLILLLIGAGGAISADDAEPAAIPSGLQRTAAGEVVLANRRLARAEAEADARRAKATRLSRIEAAARADLRQARKGILAAEGRLATAEGEVRHYEHRLAALEKRELERREEDEAREREELEEAEEEFGGSGECDPNYAGACLDPSSPDYDCAGGSGDGPDYTGPVQVVGSDPFGLDADGDGYACE